MKAFVRKYFSVLACLGPKDCVYRNPASCTTFYQCAIPKGSNHGVPILESCPKGTEWDDYRKECAPAIYSTCSVNTKASRRRYLASLFRRLLSDIE